MSNLIINPEGFGLKIYNLFPPRYREDDIQTNYSLKRYLDACGEGGFKFSIEEWNGILNLANPDQATPQALPILYQQFGLDIFYGIPEQYLRYLLPRLGEAWSKKGSLDVIEFVVSALTGVKTIVSVSYDESYDESGNANVDIYLRMDYTISSYFPDHKQFERLIDKFLPFYLGRTIIYSFVFYDEFGIQGEDTPRLDIVTYTTNERGLFHSSGLRLVPMTFPSISMVNSHVLNVDFILNQYERVAPDPDLFWDNLKVKYHENGSFAHRFTLIDLHVPMLNTDRVLNYTFVLYDGNKFPLFLGEHLISALNSSDFRLNDQFFLSPSLYVEVDRHNDKVVTVMADTTTMKVIQNSKDHLNIKPSFHYALNTSLVLNNGFILNSDNCEYGLVRGIDDSGSDTPKVIHRESASFVFSPLLCMLTNTSGSVLNYATLKVPDEVDVVRYHDGSHQIIFR